MNFEFDPTSPPSCDICKSAPANIQFVEQKGNQTKRIALCAKCAAEQGITQTGNSISFNLPSLLAALTGASVPARPGLVCRSCGATEEDVRKSGRFGCSGCYENFQDLIAPLVNRIHSGATHRGLAPGRMSELAQKAELEDLRCRLDECVRSENYEEAASLRDRIRALEGHRG